MTNIDIAFPRVDSGSAALAIEPVPQAAANTGLATFAGSSAARQTLTCKDLLHGDTRRAAEREAAELFPEMLNNTEVVMTFGTSALEGVNTLIDRLLHEVEPEKIPELTDLMKSLNREMRGVRSKYDVSDPKVREKYENYKGGIGRFFGNVKTLVELLMEDVQSLETQLNKVVKTLENRQFKMRRNVVFYDALYEENEIEIGKLIYVIGVMELICDIAANEASKIKVGEANLGDRGAERKAEIAGLAEILANRVAEYKGRLFVAWATAPQVRMMRTLNVSLAMRINTLLTITIPTMKGTIVQWRMLMQSKDAADMSNVVADASNEWLQSYAQAGAVVVPMIAEAVSTPTLRPDTVFAMAASIEAQANGIVKAIEAGVQQRAALDDSMVKAQIILRDSAGKVSDAVIDQFVTKATKPLEITTQVIAEDAQAA